MGAEERTHRAIELTRSTVERALNDPMFLLGMAAADVGPRDVEDVITEIMDYLVMTAPEKLVEGAD